MAALAKAAKLGDKSLICAGFGRRFAGLIIGTIVSDC
jgi:hypothetical protein